MYKKCIRKINLPTNSVLFIYFVLHNVVGYVEIILYIVNI